ncbi:MAG: ELM1/GtrOC1 family putative glycosyltransferase [Synergistaceae bacterium]
MLFNKKVKFVLVLKDGDKIHDSNCDGISYWLSKLGGMEILETKIPKLSGVQKTKVQNASRNLMFANRRDAREWLAASNGDMLVRHVGQLFAERNIREGSEEVLMISSGSSSAPYNLALGLIWRCYSTTINTPEPLGTEPFDFAIIPDNEFPERKTNIFTITGNMSDIDNSKIESAKERYLTEYPPKAEKVWSLIIGGNNGEYCITSEWIKRKIVHLSLIAEQEKAELLILVLGHLEPEAVKTIKAIEYHATGSVKVFIKEENSYDPRIALYGLSQQIFCTEDQYDTMIEILTAGKRVIVLRTAYKKGINSLLQETAEKLVLTGALSSRMLWGRKRQDLFIDNLIRKNYVIEFRDWISTRNQETFSWTMQDTVNFNEARRSAKWIMDNFTTEV